MLSLASSTEKVTGKTIEAGDWVFYPATENIVLEGETYKASDKVQILELSEINSEYWVKCDTNYGLRYISINNLDNFEVVEDKQEKSSKKQNKSEKNTDTVTIEGKHSRTVRVTAYCKACNGGGGLQTASGKRPRALKTCAMNGVPLGTVIHLEKYNLDLIVNDRTGSKNKNHVDIYIGDYDRCRCSKAGYHGKDVAIWD